MRFSNSAGPNLSLHRCKISRSDRERCSSRTQNPWHPVQFWRHEIIFNMMSWAPVRVLPTVIPSYPRTCHSVELFFFLLWLGSGFMCNFQVEQAVFGDQYNERTHRKCELMRRCGLDIRSQVLTHLHGAVLSLCTTVHKKCENSERPCGSAREQSTDLEFTYSKHTMTLCGRPRGTKASPSTVSDKLVFVAQIDSVDWKQTNLKTFRHSSVPK